MSEQYISFWRNTTNRISYPPVKNNMSVDVAIIGGGIAGVMASWFLNKAGIKSAIFESFELGGGTSGNTTAKVTSFHDLKYRYLYKKFKESGAYSYAESNQWAINELERIIHEENINCDFSRIPLNVFALSEQGLKKLGKEFVSVKKLGLPATFVESHKTVPFSIKGEIRFENQAVFHPGKFINRISEILVEQDIKIFENSKILKVEDSPVPTIHTRDFEIKAKKIIIATNYPIYDKGLLFLRMNQVRSYAIAAKLNKPVPKEMFIGVDSGNLYLRSKAAIFKNPDGNINSYSASCTHMGCTVTWNPIEKSWDCPCHGSRFDTNGQVLNSPSIKPLNEKSIK